MIIIRKIFPALAPLPAFKLLLQPAWCFSAEPPRKQLQQMHSKLVSEAHKLKPAVVVKMLHFSQTQSQKKSGKPLYNHQQLDKIVGALSGGLHSMSHEDVTLLLQTLSGFPKYALYARQPGFMKLVLKKLNSLQPAMINPKYMFRLLNMLDLMKFPPMIVAKYVNLVNNRQKDKKQFQSTYLLRLDYLKFLLLILELKFINFRAVLAFFDNEVKNIKVVQPKEMCYYYYIHRILERCIKEKLAHFSTKIQVHDLLFNPYSQLSTPESAQQTSPGTPEPSPPGSEQPSQAHILTEQANKLVTALKHNFDFAGLKSQLYRHFSFEKYPLQSSTAILLRDMQQLKPQLAQFMTQYYMDMQVYEFVNLAHTVERGTGLKYYDQYMNKYGSEMGMYDKLRMLKCKAQVLSYKIGKQEIIEIVRQGRKVSTRSFQLITELSVRHLDPDSQMEVLKLVEQLADSPVQ